MKEQSPRLGDWHQFSESESRFNRHWRELIDKAGGQARVVNRLGWSKSTVSRDYRGEIPPTDERLRQLSDFVGLSRPEYERLLRLLEQARLARQDRKGQPATMTKPLPVIPASGMVPGGNYRWPSLPPLRLGRGWTDSPARRRRAALAGAFMVVLLVAGAVLMPDLWQGTTGAPVAQGSVSGIGIKVVGIAKRSLSQKLQSAFGQGRTAGAGTVDGYVLRNMKGPTLCLTAVDTGSTAGQDGDRVEVDPCDGAANQVWIPQQWEVSGTSFTWLVNDRYQDKCLNARERGGLHKGQPTMLWDCYQSSNEYWDFGDWFTSVKKDDKAYPIFVKSDRLCLDAVKGDYRDGDVVQVWTQYATGTNQFWS